MSLQTRLVALAQAVGADIKNLNTQVAALGSTSTTTVIDGGATPYESYTGIAAASGSGSGGIPTELADAKGDLFVATAADIVTRLPVGATTGHVLTINPASSVGISWQAPSGVPSNMLTTDTEQVITGIKTFEPGDLLMRNAAGTVTAEPYSDVNPPGTLERLLVTEPASPPAGESVEWSTDGKSLRMKAPDGTVTLIGPSAVSGATRTELVVAADQAIQNATAAGFVDITSLSWAAAANTSYEIEGILWFTVVATTTGHRWGFVGPGLALANIVIEYQTSATAQAIYNQQHNNTTMAGTPPMPIVTASALAGVPNILRIKGYIRNGATAGTLKMQGASELSTASVTVLKGSTLSYKAI